METVYQLVVLKDMFLLFGRFFLFSVTGSGGQSDPGQGFGGHFETNILESEGGGPNPISRVSFSVSKDNWSTRSTHSRCSVPTSAAFTLEAPVWHHSNCDTSRISEKPPVTTWTRSVLSFWAGRGVPQEGRGPRSQLHL